MEFGNDIVDCSDPDADRCNSDLAPQQGLGLRTQRWPELGGRCGPHPAADGTAVTDRNHSDQSAGPHCAE